MTIDLTGGFSDDLEFVFASPPDHPEMHESVNAWIWDDGGDFALPRCGVEAVAAQWETHGMQVNLAFADGRVFNVLGQGPTHDPTGSDGRPRILGAGPISMELVEPYRHLRLRVHGEATATTVEAQMGGELGGGTERVPVDIDIDIRPAVPPWMNGSLLDDARRVMETQEEGDLMGYPWRFEQLCRAEGNVRIGDETRQLRGGANRIRRQSIRRTATLRGHAWQAAVFPSGRGFSYITYPPRDDGLDTYNEGYIFDGDGALIPARATVAPWLRTLTPSGEDVSCRLETEDGRVVEIRGETLLSTYMVMPPDLGGGLQLHQAVSRYTWDGESANGMLERSTAPAKLSA